MSQGDGVRVGVCHGDGVRVGVYHGDGVRAGVLYTRDGVRVGTGGGGVCVGNDVNCGHEDGGGRNGHCIGCDAKDIDLDGHDGYHSAGDGA